jgi:hypothetical protein
MAISFKKACDFVYRHGALWERVLFAHLFQGAPLAHLLQCLACYKNPDGGWGHGLEHDIKTPDSHPLAMEFALHIVRTTQINPRNLFNDAPEWLETRRAPDGSLLNPASVLAYPCAEWWQATCGQITPDSIVGNLMGLGLCTPTLAESTLAWVQEHLTLEKIRANDWLFMAYHAYDYYTHVEDFPNVEVYRRAAVDNVIALAEAAPPAQVYQYFLLAPVPTSPLAQATPPALRKRLLDALAAGQQGDGAWHDQHGLAHWYSWTTMVAMLALRSYGVYSFTCKDED